MSEAHRQWEATFDWSKVTYDKLTEVAFLAGQRQGLQDAAEVCSHWSSKENIRDAILALEKELK